MFNNAAILHFFSVFGMFQYFDGRCTDSTTSIEGICKPYNQCDYTNGSKGLNLQLDICYLQSPVSLVCCPVNLQPIIQQIEGYVMNRLQDRTSNIFNNNEVTTTECEEETTEPVAVHVQETKPPSPGRETSKFSGPTGLNPTSYMDTDLDEIALPTIVQRSSALLENRSSRKSKIYQLRGKLPAAPMMKRKTPEKEEKKCIANKKGMKGVCKSFDDCTPPKSFKDELQSCGFSFDIPSVCCPSQVDDDSIIFPTDEEYPFYHYYPIGRFGASEDNTMKAAEAQKNSTEKIPSDKETPTPKVTV